MMIVKTIIKRSQRRPCECETLRHTQQAINRVVLWCAVSLKPEVQTHPLVSPPGPHPVPRQGSLLWLEPASIPAVDATLSLFSPSPSTHSRGWRDWGQPHTQTPAPGAVLSVPHVTGQWSSMWDQGQACLDRSRHHHLHPMAGNSWPGTPTTSLCLDQSAYHVFKSPCVFFISLYIFLLILRT